MDGVLRDGMEDATISLPRGTRTWTHGCGNSANVVGR